MMFKGEGYLGYISRFFFVPGSRFEEERDWVVSGYGSGVGRKVYLDSAGSVV